MPHNFFKQDNCHEANCDTKQSNEVEVISNWKYAPQAHDREKVVGKRKGKNRAREERMFFSLGAQPGFFAEEEEQWSG